MQRRLLCLRLLLVRLPRRLLLRGVLLRGPLVRGLRLGSEGGVRLLEADRAAVLGDVALRQQPVATAGQEPEADGAGDDGDEQQPEPGLTQLDTRERDRDQQDQRQEQAPADQRPLLVQLPSTVRRTARPPPSPPCAAP
nr:hypothetical protein GCM10020092_030440 [Actinoplanes digitatis]